MKLACSGEIQIAGMPAEAAARFNDFMKGSSPRVRFATYSK